MAVCDVLGRLNPARATPQAGLDLFGLGDRQAGRVTCTVTSPRAGGQGSVLRRSASWTGLCGTRAGKPAPGRASRPGEGASSALVPARAPAVALWVLLPPGGGMLLAEGVQRSRSGSFDFHSPKALESSYVSSVWQAGLGELVLGDSWVMV